MPGSLTWIVAVLLMLVVLLIVEAQGCRASGGTWSVLRWQCGCPGASRNRRCDTVLPDDEKHKEDANKPQGDAVLPGAEKHKEGADEPQGDATEEGPPTEEAGVEGCKEEKTTLSLACQTFDDHELTTCAPPNEQQGPTCFLSKADRFCIDLGIPEKDRTWQLNGCSVARKASEDGKLFDEVTCRLVCPYVRAG